MLESAMSLHSHSRLEVLDTLAVLLECHTARVVDKNNNVKESNLCEIYGDLHWQPPLSCELLESTSLDDTLSNLVNSLGVGVERLNVLLLSDMALYG